MPDLIAVYGALTGSAGLLGLAWQVAERRQDRRDHIELQASHDYVPPILTARSEEEQAGQRMGERSRLEGETFIQVINHSQHPVTIAGIGMFQPDVPTSGSCHQWRSAEEVKSRRRSQVCTFADQYAVDAEGMSLRDFPVVAYVELDDGKMYYSDPIWLFAPPAKRTKLARLRGRLQATRRYAHRARDA